MLRLTSPSEKPGNQTVARRAMWGPMLGAACFALAWCVARAHLQSITVDEADSLSGYVLQDLPRYWYPTSGNHVLNSIVMKVAVALFGVSHLTVRAGALIGAAVYLAAVLRICTLLDRRRVIVWPLFLCLIFNPFLMDFMVAGRGYAMALGFLMTAIALLGRQILTYGAEDGALYRAAAWASVCLALSFSASFPFAFVDCAVPVLFYVWACRYRDRIVWPRLAAACAVPGLLVTLFVCGSVLAEWPKGQLYYGSDSVREMWKGFVTASFFELNPYLVNTLVLPILDAMRRVLPFFFAAACAAQFVLIVVRRHQTRLNWLAIYLAGVAGAAMAGHWLGFALFHILLPKDRTGIFFVPLCVLAFGTSLAALPEGKFAQALRVGGIAMLCLGSIYFLGCLRLLYFQEWKFGADVRRSFPALQELHKVYGFKEVNVESILKSSYEFYRTYYHESRFTFTSSDAPAPGKDAYEMPAWQGDFAVKEGLKIVWKGEISSTIIAIRERPGGAP